MRYPFRLMVAICLVLIFTMSLVTASCSQPVPSQPAQSAVPSSATTQPAQTSTTAKPAPSTSASVAPPSSTAAPAKVFNLKYNNQNPETGWGSSQASIPWLKSIEAATKGQVKITPYFSETLLKAANSWQGVATGVADMGWVAQSLMTSMHPLGDYSILPALPYKSSVQASGIFWQLMDKYPSFKNEFKDVKILNTVVTSPYFFITSKKQIKTIEDMNGLKMRVAGGTPTAIMKAVGAVPQVVSMTDTYMNIQKGVLDGMATPWEALISFRQYEVVKYYTYYPAYSGYILEVMNLDTWNSLPPDVQKAIDSVSGLKGSQDMGKNFYDLSAAAGRDAAKKGGFPMEEYTPTAAELQRWTDMAKPIWEQWIKDVEAKGYKDARAILTDALDLINTYNP